MIRQDRYHKVSPDYRICRRCGYEYLHGKGMIRFNAVCRGFAVQKYHRTPVFSGRRDRRNGIGLVFTALAPQRLREKTQGQNQEERSGLSPEKSRRRA
jgi:hypothetical protein